MGSVAEKGRSGGGLVGEEIRSFKMARNLELEPRPSEIRPIRLPSESYSLTRAKFALLSRAFLEHRQKLRILSAHP